MYADDLILISASVDGLQPLLNCCHTVSLDLLLKFNCAKSTCIAIGLRLSCNVSNMQLGNDLISWSNKLKYLGVMFNVGKTLSIDVDVIRGKFVPPATVFLGILNTKMKFSSCVCKSHMLCRSFSMLVQQLDLPSHS